MNSEWHEELEARGPATNTPHEWMRAILWLLSRLTLIVFFVVGGLYVLGRLHLLIIYIVIATILAYIMCPIATWMARRSILVPKRWSMHMRRSVTTFYVLILVFVGGYFSVKFMLSPFVTQITDVARNWNTDYKPRFDSYIATARDWYTEHLKPEWREKIERAAQDSGGGEAVQKQVAAVAGNLGHALGGVAHQVVEIVLLPVLAFYFALDSRRIKHEFVALLRPRWRRETSRMIYEFNQIMYSYVIGQAILCALAGVFIGLLLAALNVPFALTLGLLAGFTRAIPIVGPILGGIPIIVMTLITAGLGTAVTILIIFTILHFAESKFIMPKLIGDRMDLHPVVIIVVLLIGQEFGGLLGMFFAPPLAALLRVVIRRYWLKCHRNPPKHGGHGRKRVRTKVSTTMPLPLPSTNSE